MTILRTVRVAAIQATPVILDAEATVTSYEAGKGRHKGRVGALWVKLGNGKECKVGTGLKDKDRENPPAVGAVVPNEDLLHLGLPVSRRGILARRL